MLNFFRLSRGCAGRVLFQAGAVLTLFIAAAGIGRTEELVLDELAQSVFAVHRAVRL